MKPRLIIQIISATILLAIGFLAGSRYQEHRGASAIQKTIEPYKAEISSALAGMSAADIKETLQQIKTFSRSAVQEFTQKTLFEAMMSRRLLAIKKAEGDAAAWDFVNLKLEDFKNDISRPNYDAGGWTKVARALEKGLKSTEPNQSPEPTTMAVTPPATQEPRQP